MINLTKEQVKEFLYYYINEADPSYAADKLYEIIERKINENLDALVEIKDGYL